jgi:hypothetical protein
VAWQRPDVPRHYSHVRIALLAFAGNPMGPFEDQLLRESVDLVVAYPPYLKHIHEVAPRTPALIYTNHSNVYHELFTDWLAYADRHGLSREAAFYHAARPLPFRGDSPSSQPTTWFWGVYRDGRRLQDLTTGARSRGGRVPFPVAGGAMYVGYPEPFCEINVRLASPAGDGWSAALEYAGGVDDDGRPTAWRAVPVQHDTTDRLTQSGRLAFDAPADWRPTLVGGAARLYYVRFRADASGRPPVAENLLGRDYVGAHGTTAGTIPVFDAAADADGDGYLNDAEYARRAPGKDARFRYESRLFVDGYGQMRYWTRPSDPAFRAWCVDYHRRLLEKHPLAGGLCMDNCGGKVPVKTADVLEPVTTYTEDLALVLEAVARSTAPRLVLENVVGGNDSADTVIRHNPVYTEEAAIRPLSYPWVFFEDLAARVARRSALTAPPPYAVLDSHPQRGDPLDPRWQLAALAEYYLLADPDSTFLTFNGGNEPASPWRRHWVPAAAFDVGRPTGTWSLFVTGTDPAKPAFTYKVYRRPYQKALVLFKPLSYVRGTREAASNGDETATRHELGATYRPLRADGSLGDSTRAVTLCNGEGAILVKME